MSRACSNCGGTGHNSRTCERPAVARELETIDRILGDLSKLDPSL